MAPIWVLKAFTWARKSLIVALAGRVSVRLPRAPAMVTVAPAMVVSGCPFWISPRSGAVPAAGVTPSVVRVVW